MSVLDTEPRYVDIENRHVLVTGGASGIGASIVHEFRRQGAHVSILDILPPPPDVLADQGIRFTRCDLRKPSELEAAVEARRESFGPIEILINNAAHDHRHSLSEADCALWDDLMAVNLRAAHLACRAVQDDMCTAGWGVIVNLSSNSFLLGLAGYPVYATAKAGLWGMTKALARELGGHNVRVNCLVPGWVMTERQRKEHVTPEALESCLNEQCLKEALEPKDIANGCLFLASDASRMMTGQMLVIDGGRV